MAIEDFKRQEKYKWHDLRKNPEDLPEEGADNVLFCYKHPVCRVDDILCERLNECDYFDDECKHVYLMYEVNDGEPSSWDDGFAIAWREIEPFEEEE